MLWKYDRAPYAYQSIKIKANEPSIYPSSSIFRSVLLLRNRFKTLLSGRLTFFLKSNNNDEYSIAYSTRWYCGFK